MFRKWLLIIYIAIPPIRNTAQECFEMYLLSRQISFEKYSEQTSGNTTFCLQVEIQLGLVLVFFHRVDFCLTSA